MRPQAITPRHIDRATDDFLHFSMDARQIEQAPRPGRIDIHQNVYIAIRPVVPACHRTKNRRMANADSFELLAMLAKTGNGFIAIHDFSAMLQDWGMLPL